MHCLVPVLSARRYARRWARFDIDLFHAADIVFVVSSCLAEASRVEEHPDQAEVRFLVIAVLPEQLQHALHCRVDVTSVA